MGHNIPKIQYKNYALNGTTSIGSNTVTGIADTSSIENGMFVRGTGIPTGALVTGKTVNSVTFSGAAATANGTVSIAYGFEIIFDYPPIEQDGEQLDPHETVTTSLSGIQQVIVDYIEAYRSPVFSFVSESIKNKIDTFARYHLVLGKTFRYFDDRDSITYIEYESKNRKYSPIKIAPKGENIYVWKMKLEFRRIL